MIKINHIYGTKNNYFIVICARKIIDGVDFN